ncbi:hypothetical protein PoB_007339300 [Plakobranchus ocellatus]|uniref:Uncharacterized protein n=1 Tax=Plakobranchus ocellatus TaxID=259542 RepID=A0AAV4DRF4_9GAST|nr:hypothetical protein PoB_007339300 [Plakobranchus ocellatus]
MSQTRLTQGFGGKINGTSKSTLDLPLDVDLPLDGSSSGRWVRAVPSSSGQYHHRSSFLAGLRSLPRPRCPTTGTRQHSVLSGPAHGHHVVALTSGSGWIYDASNSYTASFIIHGGLVAFSGLILIPVKFALVRSKRRGENVAAAAAAFGNAALVVDDGADAAKSDAVDVGIVYIRAEHVCETDKTAGGKDYSLSVTSDVLY